MSNTGSRRIVIVDDNDDIAYFMRRAYGAVRVDQYAAMSPEAWVGAEVAVIDHRMPDHNGCDVGAVARATNPEMRLILYTAFPQDVEKSCRELFDVVLMKPVSFEDLLEALDG